MSTFVEKIKIFWEKYDQKILIIAGFILLSVVSFNAGRTYESNIKPAEIKVSLNQSPLAAANPKQEKIMALGEAVERSGQAKETIDPVLASGQNAAGSDEKKECAFVGSKNSNKYHLPSCRYATNIKEENRVCFSSKEEAESKGYETAKCCIK